MLVAATGCLPTALPPTLWLILLGAVLVEFVHYRLLFATAVAGMAAAAGCALRSRHDVVGGHAS